MALTLKYIRKQNKRNLLCWVAMSLIIFLSGCVYFTQVYRLYTTIIFFFVTVILYYLSHKNITIKKAKIAFEMIGCLLLNFIFNSDTLTTANLQDYVLIIVQILGIMLFSCVVSLEEIRGKFVDVMVTVAIVSLICFFIQLNMPEIMQRLASTSIRPGYTISWYHTWGWSYVFNRNAGPFWEPGGYQGYLAAAILMVLNRKNLKNNYIVLIILGIALVTTMSTTGYIILAILATYFVYLYAKETTKKSKDKAFALARVVIILIAAVVFIQRILNSSTITNKFLNTNMSYSMRFTDITQSIKLVFNHPILGYGIMSSDLTSEESTLGMTGNSVGLMAGLCYLGLLIGGVYLIALFLSFLKFYNRLNAVIVIAVFTIIFMTESLMTFPFYFGMILFTSSGKNKENFRGEIMNEDTMGMQRTYPTNS